MAYTKSETVHFNVGGTKYEVVRSLLDMYPDTMLATLVSQRWNESNEKAVEPKDDDIVFIDSDGSRFMYVLDYMRRQKVHLPASISKKAFLEDLKYFGFANVPNTAIEVANIVLDSGDQLSTWATEHKESIAGYDTQIETYTQQIKDIERTIKFEKFAFHLCKLCFSSGRVFSVGVKEEPWNIFRDEADRILLNEKLRVYGLKYKGPQGGNLCNVQLVPADDQADPAGK